MSKDKTKHESRIKRQWLVSLYAYNVLFYVAAIIDSAFGEAFDGFPRGSYFFSEARVLVSHVLFVPIFLAIPALITYHYAYKKHGIGLLVFIMLFHAVISIFYVKQLTSYGFHDWSYVGCPTGIMLRQALMLYLSGYYLINCYRLYKVNRETP